MDSAPILLPSPRKSPFRPPYEQEIHLDNTSSDEDPYSYDHSPDEAVFDEDSTEDSQDSQSPHTSDDDVVSEFPTDGDSRAPSTIYTPHKRRSPFRHPSSVKNLQLDTTPPHLASPPKSGYRLSPSPHSRTGTPRSTYSSHSRPRSTRSSPSKKEKVKKAKTERPLVLLHFTLLPFQPQYSQSLLDDVLPAAKLADYKLLKEKLSQVVVQERGVLIPHPRDDYELLEERFLEALELEQGTLTKDGHFVVPEDRGASRTSRSVASTRFDEEDSEEPTNQSAEDEERTEMGEQDATHLCEDCGRHIQAVGSDRRWDIRIYAANGLMREGAWSAAWHEMERVDVEVQPYLSDDTKRDLEDRLEELDLLLQAERRESAARRHEEAAVKEVVQTVKSEIETGARLSGPDEDRMREIYGAQAEEKMEELANDFPAHEPLRRESILPATSDSKELPLSRLLVNYFQLLLQDRRNVVIGFLTATTLLLAIISAQSKQTSLSNTSGAHNGVSGVVSQQHHNAQALQTQTVETPAQTEIDPISVGSSSSFPQELTEPSTSEVSMPAPATSLLSTLSDTISSTTSSISTAIESLESVASIDQPLDADSTSAIVNDSDSGVLEFTVDDETDTESDLPNLADGLGFFGLDDVAPVEEL